jgi:hypothetical protein
MIPKSCGVFAQDHAIEQMPRAGLRFNPSDFALRASFQTTSADFPVLTSVR